MIHRVLVSLAILFAPLSLSATVGPVISGQSLWWIDKRIAATYDIIESKIDAIDQCGDTVLSSADIMSTNTIIISTPGNYCLSQDVTADIVITNSLIALDLNDHCVTGVIDVGDFIVVVSGGGSSEILVRGSGVINDIIIANGTILPPAPTDVLPPAAVTINSTVNRLQLRDLQIVCTDTDPAMEAQGRSGIKISGDNVRVTRCSIIAGAGGNGSGLVAGFAGGDGIELTSFAQNAIVSECAFSSGNGGNGAVVGAGRAGYGIYVNDSNSAELLHNIVMETGDVGTAGVGGLTANYGIFVTPSGIPGSSQIVVRDCIIRNVGAPESGETRYGVKDESSNSTIFRNIAYDIAGTIGVDKIYFALQGSSSEGGINLATTTTLVPTVTIGNYMVNVFM